MTTSVRDLQERSFGATMRRDAWWIQPVLTAIVLGSFGLYATWAAWVGNHYEWGPYLSPFYSPLIQTTWWPLSPAFLILIFPLGFRATCYYYRKAYYRAFFLDPVACAVGEPRHGYKGETKFPFILQNMHRFFMYAAVIFIFILGYDVWLALRWPVNGVLADGAMAAGPKEFGVGIGTLVMALNVILLASYTFGCHSIRHLIGGMASGEDDVGEPLIRDHGFEPHAIRSLLHLGDRNLAADRDQHDANGRRRRCTLHRSLSRAAGTRPCYLTQPVPREREEAG